MSFRLERRESVQDGLRRIADEQLERALAEIDDEALDRPEVVHQVRTRYKKLRGLLRLVRPACEELYERENATFRDAAGDLSHARDAEVLVETCDWLVEKHADEANREVFGSIRGALDRRRDELAGSVDLGERLAATRATIEEARQRVRDWRLDEKGFDAVAGGLGRTYGRGRDAMQAAYDELTAEAFHEWRKQTKDHWYHTRLLRDVWRKPMQARDEEASRLADRLGELHDLAVLDATLDEEPDRFPDAGATQSFRDLVEAGRRDLRSRAHRLGRRLFAEKADRHVDRIRAYWKTWRR